MNQKSAYALRIKVLIGMGAFLLLVTLQAAFLLKTLKTTENNHRLLGELNQLEEQVDGLARRSRNYLDNAARDFESYRRDVTVYHRDQLGDFKHFSTRLDMLREQFDAGVGTVFPSYLEALSGGADEANALSLSVDSAWNQWLAFDQGFMDQLGTDENEPRIEWGATFVVEQYPSLREAVTGMVNRYRDYLNHQAELSASIARFSLGGLVLLGVLGIVWFYRRVIRRIGATVDACQIVAGGDFGYTLPVEGNDEITVLSRAFNTLSSRSQLVLGMMANLQQIQSVEQGLAVIVQASGSYLPVAWAGFMEVSRDGDKLYLSNAIPPKTLQGWMDRQVSVNEPFGKRLTDALISNKSVLVDELAEHVVAHEEEGFLRNLVRATQVEALMALPVKSGRGWEGVILFGSRSAEYRADQAELLEKMAPLFASTFERMAREQATQRGELATA